MIGEYVWKDFGTWVHLSHYTILEIRNAIWETKRPRLTIKNAFQRAYSTNLENISVHLVIEIEKFWKSNSSVIWEIKRDKFWKSKVSFEKSNATNFGNQKWSLEKSNAINFGNQKCHSVIWEIKRDKFWKSKVLFEKSNAINFGNQKCHLRNQTQQTLEIKIVIGEIKRDKFKIKMTQ